MPDIAQNGFFTSGQFKSSDLLKFIQENGSKVLWREVSGLDSVTKKGEWPGGKQVNYHLTVDPGALAFGGLNSVGGTFAPNDRSYGIQGFIVPKYQTLTMYFDRVLKKLTDSDAKAYMSHMKLEYSQKIMFQKSFFNLQQLMDGTGRMATPVGIGPNNLATGASFTLASPSTLLKVKLSSLDTATGSAAYLMEGQVVSFAFLSYDESVVGTVDNADPANAAVIPRFLCASFIAGSTASFFDAFRVVRINQASNDVYLAPARKCAPDGADQTHTNYAPYSTWSPDHHVQQGSSNTMWCAGSGTTTVKFFKGRAFDLSVPAAGATEGPIDIKAFLSPGSLTSASAATVAATFLVHPGFVPTGTTSWGQSNTDFSTYSSTGYSTVAAMGKAMLGIGWDYNVQASPASVSSTDVSLLNPYFVTGLESLLTNDANVVQGIPRYSIQQMLPTKKDCEGQPLSFNTLFSFLAEHYVRNRDRDPNSADVTQWNLLTMNPIVYSSLLSLSEADRRITDDKGIRGTSCKSIQMGNKKFELDMHSAMRLDRIYALPKDSIKMYGGTMDPVEVDGQKVFMSLNSNGKRTNAMEQYFTIQSEQYVDNLRDAAFLRNFSINTL